MRSLLTIATAALVALPTTASAQLTLGGNATSTPVTVNDGTRAITASFNWSLGEALVGPFQMTFGGIFGSAIAEIVCVDLNNEFFDGQSYGANLTLLSSTGTDLTQRTRIGMATGNATLTSDTYVRLAWLAGQYGTAATSEWAGIQGAIWRLSSGVAPLGGTTNPNVQHWLDLVATADLSTVDRNAWAVVTDETVTGTMGGVQEFLVPVNVVPEPSTYVLLSTGLLGVFVIARRRTAA